MAKKTTITEIVVFILYALIGIAVVALPILQNKWPWFEQKFPLTEVNFTYISIIGFIVTFSAALITLLLRTKLNQELEKLNDIKGKILDDKIIGGELFRWRNEWVTDKELKGIERSDMSKGRTQCHVIIISNDLSLEDTKPWRDLVIENINDNVKYSYYTTRGNKSYLSSIKAALSNKPNAIKGNLSIFYNDMHFHFMPKCYAIVIYDFTDVTDKEREYCGDVLCYRCSSNYSAQELQRDNKPLLYEQLVLPRYYLDCLEISKANWEQDEFNASLVEETVRIRT